MWSLVGGGTLLALAGFVVVGLAVGHWLAGERAEDRTVLALSTATRHPGVAMALAGAVAAEAARPEGRLVAPAILLYLLIGAIVSAVYLAIRRKSARGAERPVDGPPAWLCGSGPLFVDCAPGPERTSRSRCAMCAIKPESYSDAPGDLFLTDGERRTPFRSLSGRGGPFFA
jgi:hypothetical protein